MPGYRILKLSKKERELRDNDLSEVVTDYQFNKNNMEKGKWYNSSADANALSLTIKGFLLAWIPVVLAVGQYYDMPLTREGLTQLIQSITTFVSAGMVIFGFIRKLYFWFSK